MTTTTTYMVEGLTCPDCVAEVMEQVRSMPEVSGVAVELVRQGASPLFVRSVGSLPLSAVRARVEPAGFHVSATNRHRAIHLQRTFTGATRRASSTRGSRTTEAIWL